MENKESQLKNLKDRIQHLKAKRPGYAEILDFYQKVREQQERVKSILKIEPILPRKEWKEFPAKEGFSLLEKKDIPLDIETSFSLFQSLCRIGKGANPYLAKQATKIEEFLNSNKLDVKGLLKQWLLEQKISGVLNELGVDKKVFQFLIESSIRPLIEATVEQLQNEFDSKDWMRGSCPICGSLPFLSLLKEEVGKRYLLCSFCGYSWRSDRMICPFCNNKDQDSLHYFYGEGEDPYRIDLCDQCHQYIKTIDLRTLPEADPSLEDLATLHLDLLASQKGFKRPIPNLWIPNP
ncbi:MAG: hypothetical protein A2156_05880 [Deltaproteobacteria bacterium RBG_16_48_10]|nr:MAG: hypothetical protein A2156_05880 [Deltaproteobacteria bacterium RBG_16_48_10]